MEERSRLLKNTAICTAIFAVIVFVVIMIRVGTRSVLLAEAAKISEEDILSLPGYTVEIIRLDEEESNGEEIAMDAAEDDAVESGSDVDVANLPLLEIDLPSGITADMVVVTNHYRAHQLWIDIGSDAFAFYKDHPVQVGNLQVKSVRCIPRDTTDRMTLVLQMEDIWEYKSELADGRIVIGAQKPSEAYEKVVVIDPLETDSGLPLELASLLEEQLNDAGVKLYFTRQTDGLEQKSTSDSWEEDFTWLAEETGADLWICLAESLDHEDIMTYYNSDFFIREFGNQEFAMQLEADCLYALGYTETEQLPGDGTALVRAGQEMYPALKQLKIPSAVVEIGTGAGASQESVGDETDTTSSEENSSFTNEESLQQLAKGILNAIAYSEVK